MVVTFGMNDVVWAKDTITWMVRNFPPLYIMDGVYKGRGIADRMMALLQENLPEYDHTTIDANIKRVEKEMMDGRKVVRLTMFKKPEREAYMLFSIPHYIAPAHKLIVRKEVLPSIRDLISADNEISLDALFRSHKLALALESGRSLSKPLDDVIKKYKDGQNITVSHYSDTEKTIKLLSLGRIDAVIEYPSVVKFILREEADKLKQLTSLTIREGTPFIVAYVAAPANEWGKTVIGKINAILEKERPTETYRAFIEQWLDESSIPGFRAEYQKVIEEAGTVAASSNETP